MKNLFKFVLTIIVIAICFASCSSNDESLNQNNISLNGEAFPIINGTILGVSIENEGHTAISLVSGTTSDVKTLTIDIPNFTKETLSGTYSFPQESGDYILNDFLTNYIFFGDTQTSSNLETGVATISHNGGNNYSVTVDLLMLDGKTFKGTYSGDFMMVFNNQ